MLLSLEGKHSESRISPWQCVLALKDRGDMQRAFNPLNNQLVIIMHVLTETKYGPAKSRITPEEVQMPMWPMNGNSHLKELSK